MLIMFGLYHHFREKFTDIRNLLLRMRIQFALRKLNSALGRFFKIYSFNNSKVFFSDINPRQNLLISLVQNTTNQTD